MPHNPRKFRRHTSTRVRLEYEAGIAAKEVFAMNESCCPRCGGVNPVNSLFCSNCGMQFGMATGIPSQPVAPTTGYYPPPPPPTYPVPPAKSNRAMIAMICAVLGFFPCGFFASVPGIVLAKQEMDAIREGRAPKSAENTARWALYLSIAATAISAFTICVYWSRFAAFM